MSLLRSLSSRCMSVCMSALLLVAASAPPRCAIECSSPLTPIYFGRKTHTSAGGSGGARHASPAPLLPHADQGVGSASLRQPAPSPRHITCRHGFEDPPMTAATTARCAARSAVRLPFPKGEHHAIQDQR